MKPRNEREVNVRQRVLSRGGKAAGAVAILALATSAAQASSLAVYSGSDPAIGPGALHPNSDVAEAQFAAAAVVLQSVNFEGLIPLGPFTTRTVASGVSMTTHNLSALAGISADNTNSSLGFNTTSGGSQYFKFANNLNSAGSVDFNFSSPINAFGAYFTGIESTVPTTIHIEFSDGTSQDLTVASNSVAGVSFFGFTDAGAAISTISISEDVTGLPSKDIFGIDDVLFQSTLAVTGVSGAPPTLPAPASVWGGGAMLLVLGAIAARRRRQAQRA